MALVEEEEKTTVETQAPAQAQTADAAALDGMAQGLGFKNMADANAAVEEVAADDATREASAGIKNRPNEFANNRTAGPRTANGVEYGSRMMASVNGPDGATATKVYGWGDPSALRTAYKSFGDRVKAANDEADAKAEEERNNAQAHIADIQKNRVNLRKTSGANADMLSNGILADFKKTGERAMEPDALKSWNDALAGYGASYRVTSASNIGNGLMRVSVIDRFGKERSMTYDDKAMYDMYRNAFAGGDESKLQAGKNGEVSAADNAAIDKFGDVYGARRRWEESEAYAKSWLARSQSGAADAQAEKTREETSTIRSARENAPHAAMLETLDNDIKSASLVVGKLGQDATPEERTQALQNFYNSVQKKERYIAGYNARKAAEEEFANLEEGGVMKVGNKFFKKVDGKRRDVTKEENDRIAEERKRKAEAATKARQNAEAANEASAATGNQGEAANANRNVQKPVDEFVAAQAKIEKDFSDNGGTIDRSNPDRPTFMIANFEFVPDSAKKEIAKKYGVEYYDIAQNGSDIPEWLPEVQKIAKDEFDKFQKERKAEYDRVLAKKKKDHKGKQLSVLERAAEESVRKHWDKKHDPRVKSSVITDARSSASTIMP